MEEPAEAGQFNIRKWINNSCSISFKIFLIMILILVMLIPKGMVEELVHERMKRSNEAVSEVSAKWGGAQVLDGPVLSIRVKDGTENKYLHMNCKDLKIDAKVKSEERSRGIFSAVLYSADLKLDGHFLIPSEKESGLSEDMLDFSNAFITFGLSDTAGLSAGVKINIEDAAYSAKPGLPVDAGIAAGFHVPLKLSPANRQIKISTNLKINGSEILEFVPSGDNTEVYLSSDWKDPSFQGAFLPSKREVGEDSFTADWKIHELQRNIENNWQGSKKNDSKAHFGVKLIQVNDVYQRILRVIKYAILFISFTFAAVFISERITRISIHPVQYLLTGLASLFFYVFLLSLSEHLTFNIAYGVTSTVITFLIAAYAKAIFRSMKMAYTMGGISSLLYLFLFGTLQLEDYALLMGSWGLLFILAIVMYLTRGINKEEQLVRA